jgi:hypothetical protein
MGSMADYYMDLAVDRGEWFPSRPYVRSIPKRSADISDFDDLSRQEDTEPTPDDFSDLC